jgi:hypothetical protein
VQWWKTPQAPQIKAKTLWKNHDMIIPLNSLPWIYIPEKKENLSRAPRLTATSVFAIFCQ